MMYVGKEFGFYTRMLADLMAHDDELSPVPLLS